jgi:lipoprotein NlpI
MNYGVLFALLLVMCGATQARQGTDAEPCLSNVGGNPDLTIQNCTAAILSGQLTDAELSTLYEVRGNAYSAKNDFEHAIDDLGQAITLLPGNAQAYADRGVDYNRSREYDLAIADLSRAIELAPETAEAWNARGIAYSYKKDYDHARSDFDEAIRRMPEFAIAYYNRGNLHYAQQDFDLAIADFTDAVRLNPEYASAYYNRGNAQADKREYAKAIADYGEALRFRPDDPDILSARGILQFCLGNAKSALSDETRSFQMDPTDAYAALWLYLVELRNGKNARAELAKNSITFEMTEWPWPAVQLFLGKSSPAEVLAAANQAPPDDLKGQQCEANFFVGEYELLRGNRAAARTRFEATLATGLTTYYEYLAAETELTKLKRVQ